MAVVSRVSTLRFDNGAGSFRQWVATAAIQDTAEGSSVVVTVVQTSGGALAPGVADTLTLNFYNGAAGLIRAATLDVNSGSQTVTYHFTDTGNSGGATRHGTVLLDIRATKTTGGPTNTYDYETDGSPSTPPTGFSASPVDRGYIRGTTTAVLGVSNISAGGGQNAPAQFPEDLFVRATLGSPSYINRAQTLILSEGATPKRTGASAAGVGPTWDVSFTGTSTTTGRVNSGLSASNHTLTSSITLPNDATTGIAYTALTSTTAGTITADPRLTAEWLLQLDNDAFATPPLSLDEASDLRTFPSDGFVAVHFRAARGTRVGSVTTGGVNNLTATITADPQNPGSTLAYAGRTTATQGGEAGWLSLAGALAAWTQFPRGLWDWSVVITAPADITGATYLLNSAEVFSLVAVDPNIHAICGSSNYDRLGGHFQAGRDPLFMGFTLRDVVTHKRVIVDEPAQMEVYRFNYAALELQWLDPADYKWKSANNASAIAAFTLGATPDPAVFASVIPTDGTAMAGADVWTHGMDYFVIGKGKSDGVFYSSSDIHHGFGPASNHGSPLSGLKIGPFFDRK